MVDGVTDTTGIYSGAQDWYGNIGDTVTIELSEEMMLTELYVYIGGNWTGGNVEVFDAAGNLTHSKFARANSSTDAGPATKEAIFTTDNEPVKVKTIVLGVSEHKWGSNTTYKVAEVEIYAESISGGGEGGDTPVVPDPPVVEPDPDTPSRVTIDQIENVYANDGNPASDNVWNMFDEDYKTAGIYTGGTDWYGNIGDTLTIELAEEMMLTELYLYVGGNYTGANVKVFDANGVMTTNGYALANASNDAGATGYKAAIHTSDRTPVKVKKIVVEIANLKWESNLTFKLTEVEIWTKPITEEPPPEVHVHAYTEFIKYEKEPTETTSGKAIFECSCGETKVKDIPSFGGDITDTPDKVVTQITKEDIEKIDQEYNVIAVSGQKLGEHNKWNIFDGDRATTGIYSEGNDWYGHNGESLVITIKEEKSLNELKIYGSGTGGKAVITAKDSSNKAVFTKEITVDNGGGIDPNTQVLFSTANGDKPVNFIRLEIQITSIVEDNQWSIKFSEVELYVSDAEKVDEPIVPDLPTPSGPPSYKEEDVKLLDIDYIEDIVTSEMNMGAENAWNLFDRDYITAGIYSASKDWYGNIGDTVTITLTEEMALTKLTLYTGGNWTGADVYVYDAAGNQTFKGFTRANASNNSGEKGYEDVQFEVGEKEDGTVVEAIRIQKIVIEVKELKWNDYKTFRIMEIDIEAAELDATAPHDHVYSTFKKTVKAPTCTEKGLARYACFCGETEDRETPALGHICDMLTKTVNPTCTEDGKEIYSCVCGETEEKVLKALGHTYGMFEKYVTEPTKSKAGSAIYKCIRCSEKKELAVDALPIEEIFYLRVAEIGTNTVTLKFNIYGDATKYEVRYSEEELTKYNFDKGTVIDATITGTNEMTAVLNLSASLDKQYYV